MRGSPTGHKLAQDPSKIHEISIIMHVTIKGTCIYTCLPLRSFKKSREKSRKKKREVTAWREKKERKRKKFWSLILASKKSCSLWNYNKFKALYNIVYLVWRKSFGCGRLKFQEKVRFLCVMLWNEFMCYNDLNWIRDMEAWDIWCMAVCMGKAMHGRDL